jgi:hypothetical protein
MKKILFFPLFFFFVTGLTRAQECKKDEVVAQYELSLSTIRNQTNQIQRYITGEDVQGFSFSMIFGPSFNFGETRTKVADIRRVIERNGGVPRESLGLYDCLKKLGLNDSRRTYETSYRVFQEKKIALLEKNLELEDSVRKGTIAQNSLPN